MVRDLGLDWAVPEDQAERGLAVLGQVEVAEALEGRGAVAPACGIPVHPAVGEAEPALGEAVLGAVGAREQVRAAPVEEADPADLELAELAEERGPVGVVLEAELAEEPGLAGLAVGAGGDPGLVAQVVGAEALAEEDWEVAVEVREPAVELEVQVGKAPRRENG